MKIKCVSTYSRGRRPRWTSPRSHWWHGSWRWWAPHRPIHRAWTHWTRSSGRGHSWATHTRWGSSRWTPRHHWTPGMSMWGHAIYTIARIDKSLKEKELHTIVFFQIFKQIFRYLHSHEMLWLHYCGRKFRVFQGLHNINPKKHTTKNVKNPEVHLR